MAGELSRQKLLNKIENLLSTYYEKKDPDFKPGKTIIPLISSTTYGKEEVLEAIDSMVSTWLTMGQKVRAFERMFSKYIGTKYAVMVNSGSSANLLALSVLTNPVINKIKAGDEIITPAVTWATTVYPIVNVGAKPVFVDVDIGTYTINTKLVRESISKKTSALMPVHLLGNSCDMNDLIKISQDNDLSLIEDSCEAHGAEFSGKKVGSFGDMSTFSFFMSHHITTIEGGMLLTNNEKYYEMAKNLRAFGWTRDLKNRKKLARRYRNIDERFLFVNIGFNIRPTEIQGAFGIQQIKKLQKFVNIRRENAKYWDKKFSHLADIFILPKVTPTSKHAYFCYPLTIRSDAPFNRKELVRFLKMKKIDTRPIMAGNFVQQPSAKLFNHKIYGDLTNSELIMENGFFFGNHQKIGEEEREYIAKSIIDFVDIKTKR